MSNRSREQREGPNPGNLFYLWALCLDVFLVLDFLSLVSFNTDAEYLSQNVFA